MSWEEPRGYMRDWPHGIPGDVGIYMYMYILDDPTALRDGCTLHSAVRRYR